MEEVERFVDCAHDSHEMWLWERGLASSSSVWG